MSGLFFMGGISIASQLNNPKTVRAWYMYDWANSVYSLVISSAIFPIYYKAVSTVNGNDHGRISGIQHSKLCALFVCTFTFFSDSRGNSALALRGCRLYRVRRSRS